MLHGQSWHSWGLQGSTYWLICPPACTEARHAAVASRVEKVFIVVGSSCLEEEERYIDSGVSRGGPRRVTAGEEAVVTPYSRRGGMTARDRSDSSGSNTFK